MVEYATRLSVALNVVGLMNIQFVIENDQAYVIEVNPRASRTVPYLSKITGIPMVRAAMWASIGRSLAEQGYQNGLHPNQPNIAVKAPVFSFSKLTGVDINLGPEMKSTGEILGIDTDFSRALYKAMVASGIDVPLDREKRSLIVTLADPDKEEALPIIRDFASLGFSLYATSGTAAFLANHGLDVTPVKKISEGEPNLIDLIRGGKVSLLINTVSNDKKIEREAARIRRASVEHSIPCLTSLDTARALHTALAHRDEGEQWDVVTIDRYVEYSHAG
jgi:carbamoyl-phosphate synthase large subunit